MGVACYRFKIRNRNQSPLANPINKHQSANSESTVITPGKGVLPVVHEMQVLAGAVVHINCNVKGHKRTSTDDTCTSTSCSNMYSTPDGKTEGDGLVTLQTLDGLAVYDFDSDEEEDGVEESNSNMDALYEDKGSVTKRSGNTITKTNTFTTTSSRGSV